MTPDTPNTQAPPKEAIVTVRKPVYLGLTTVAYRQWWEPVEVIDFYAEPVTAH